MVPNPRRFGALTGGPSVSSQSSSNVGSSFDPTIFHVTDNLPNSVDSAQNLAALLDNSWITIASARLAFGDNITPTPAISIFPARLKGASSVSIKA
jgi:hypothetical protein